MTPLSRTVVLAQREAYIAGRMEALNVRTSAVFQQAAAEKYPLPPMPRVVKAIDDDGRSISFRWTDGGVEYRRPSDLSPVWMRLSLTKTEIEAIVAIHASPTLSDSELSALPDEEEQQNG